MKNSVLKRLLYISAGNGALLVGIAGQARAAGVLLQPSASVAYLPGAAAAVIPGGPAILLWGPLLLISILCIGALLMLIRGQRDTISSHTHAAKAPGKAGRFSAATASGDPAAGWNRHIEAPLVRSRRSGRPAELYLVAPSTPASAPLQRAGGVADLEGPILISATKR
ncbi:MAG: hypothetical protein JWR07_3692 [Nevskia sp.]|nr:hypothetical protein [Nevskia sp.]